MSSSQFIVKVQVGSAVRTRLWDAHSVEPLGYRLPWKLVRDESGVIAEHSEGGKSFRFGSDAIRAGKEFELPLPSGSPVRVTLREVEYRAMPFVTEDKTAKAHWFVFECSSLWVLDAQSLGSHYDGVSDKHNRLGFSLERKGGRWKLRLADPLLELKGVDEVSIKTRKGVRELDLSDESIGSLVLFRGVHAWRFSRVGVPGALPRARTIVEPDLRWFQKSTAGALLGFALLFLFGVALNEFWPEEEKKEELQFARLVLKKPIGGMPTPVAEPDNQAAAKTGEAENSAPVAKSESPEPLQREIPKVQKTTTQGAAPGVAQKLAQATPAPAAGLPSKPVESKEVREARVLKDQMKDLFGLKSKSALSTSGLIDRKTVEKDSQRALATSGPSGSAGLAPSVNVAQQQNVKMGYVGNGSGAGGTGSGSGSYRGTDQAGLAGARGTGKGTGFMSVVGSGGDVRMDEEGLTKNEVSKVIEEHMSEVRHCYEVASLKRPDAEGELVLNFTVNGRGKVSRTGVQNSNVSAAGIDQCVMRRLSTWTFPIPRGKIDVGVTYPFIFKRL